MPMKKIVAALTASGLAFALTACGGNTATNEAAANDVVLNDVAANDTLLTDEAPTDANLSATGNGSDIAPVDPLVGENAAAPGNAL